MKNALNWFEIPVTDIQRAAKFYGAIFEAQMEVQEFTPGFPTALFPYEQGDGAGGAVVQGEGYNPSADGAIIYLNADPDLAEPLARVEAAGGRVVMPKTDIGENGYFAYIIDTEGNKVGLHSSA